VSAKKERRRLDGVLLLDKPHGITSQGAVSRAKRLLGAAKVGHTGTLDPMATGVLPLVVGKATRISQYLMSVEKEYTGTIKLGETTNTQDAEGEVLTSMPVSALTEDDVRSWVAETLAGFKVPSKVEFRDELPHNASGKVLKHLLQSPEKASDFVEE